MAYAYENAKNYDAAIQSLHEVLASGATPYKSDAMLALGRNLALKGDKPKAIEAYAQVSRDFRTRWSRSRPKPKAPGSADQPPARANL